MTLPLCPITDSAPALRGNARVCGDCWPLLRPDEYEPPTRDADDPCAICHEPDAGQHRVSWTEVAQYRAGFRS